MRITSVSVPVDGNVVLVGVHLGIPGATGEFRFTPDQARQLGHDLIGAADSAEPRIINTSRSYVLKAEPGHMHSIGKRI